MSRLIKFVLKFVFFEIIFQNLSSSLAITSINLLVLIFWLPIKLMEDIFILFPLFISNKRSILLFSNFLILLSILAKLYKINANEASKSINLINQEAKKFGKTIPKAEQKVDT